MAGYGKNPAWAGSQPGYGQQSMGGYQQNPMMHGQGMGMGGLSSGMGGITYPTPRGGQQQQQPPFMQQQQQVSMGAAPQAGQRIFNGTVTKLHDTFGFIDDEVFFQMSVCKGAAPRVNDRVMVEASYNANMPFKWNATSIQVMPGQGGPLQSQGRGGGGFMGGNFGSGGGGGGGGGFGRGGGRARSPVRRPRDQDSFRRDDRSPARSSRKRSRSPSRKSRSPTIRRTRSRSRSPPRRRARAQPRYNVSVPKISLHFPESNVIELKKRYGSLYIPSDFFAARHLWTEAFPLQTPFKIQFSSAFQVMNREYVDPVVHNKFQFDPPDADYTWVAKVMLLACPNREELIAKTCHLGGKDADDRENLVHPTRALKFLVGVKGRSETMAIGGPWSPSLDGADPANDPSVLIRTAIRTCGALTGIDLSGCTQWTNFIQIHYRRQETGSKPARTETVVIFFPDVWSVVPSKLEYDATCELYAAACQAKLEGRSLPVPEPAEDAANTSVGDSSAMEEEAEEGGEDGGTVTKKTEPTHWKLLDPKTMKVNDLKQELECRGQTSKGLKSQLQARLQKLLKGEEEAEGSTREGGEEAAAEDKEKEDEDEEKGEGDSKVPDEKKKEKIISAYKTPTHPCLFVHPNPKVKSGKFDCRVESLSVLLDYRTDDNKEGTFEVSLFAELFNEMLMRDAAFLLYRALANMPEKPKEKKKEEKKKEDKKEDKKDEEAKENGDKADDDEEKKAKEEKKEKEERERKKRREEEEEEKKEMVTVDSDLLLGCSYFDLSHCGYFESKDIEDILMTLELSLSRAEVKRLASRLLSSKDQANYRALTDVEAAKQAEKPPASGPNISLHELATGFKKYIPGASTEAALSANAEAVTESTKLVKFRGTVLDLEMLMERLDKSEKVRTSADSKIVSLQKDLDRTKEHSDRYQNARDQLANELKETRGKLRNTEEMLATTRDEAALRLTALRDVALRVKSLVEPPPQPKKDQQTETVTENGLHEKVEKMEDDKEESKVVESKPKAGHEEKAEPEAAEAS